MHCFKVFRECHIFGRHPLDISEIYNWYLCLFVLFPHKFEKSCNISEEHRGMIFADEKLRYRKFICGNHLSYLGPFYLSDQNGF